MKANQTLNRAILAAIGGIGVMAAVAVASPAQAAIVYDTSAAGELIGSRSIGNPGVVISGSGTLPTSFTVAWEIDYNGTTPGLWHYSYTFTFANGSGLQAISHMILDLSDNCSDTPGCVTNADFPSTSGTTTIGTFSGGPGNPNLSGPITGIKFDDTIGGSPFVIEFDSTRVPVYGDFYTKAGSSTNGWQAQNSGITLHASSQNILDFIARPDSVNITVPEPATLALFGLGLLGMRLRARRDRA